tara:strand:- start:1277 stop:1789 length:513 start_codon:yes stop_codon:yes gene_type:complete
MKKFLILAAFLMPSVAQADLIHKMTSSTQLTVDGAYTIGERGASTYSVSGSNIKVASADDHFGKLVAPASATAAATLDLGTYDIHTQGSAFSFTESWKTGDVAYSVGSGVDVSAGVIPDLPVLSKTTTYSGGVAGNLAGTVLSNNTNTCTAGGAGTTCIGQFVTELSILD